jgi:hypothetical protein
METTTRAVHLFFSHVILHVILGAPNEAATTSEVRPRKKFLQQQWDTY